MKTERVRDVVAEILQVDAEQIQSDTPFESFENYDSVALLSLMLMLDENLKISIDPGSLKNLKKLSDIIDIAKTQGIPFED